MDDLENMNTQVGREKRKVDRWASVAVVPQAAENADTPAQSKLKWTKVCRLFGANTESAQDEVFAAVNMYFLVNGASPYGKYEKPIRTAGGTETVAGEVVRITGRSEGEIRQFLRGRLEESYMFLKNNPAVAEDESLAAKAQNAGVARNQCFLLADWFGRDCPYFVGSEGEVYNRLRTSKIANAYDKRATAQPMPDAVRESAPEAKISSYQNGGFNRDLF